MKVAIVGAGAMGCLFAGLLARSGQEVALLDYKPARAARVRKQGVIIEGPQGVQRAAVPVSAGRRGLPRPDLVLVCVKSYDTQAAAERIRPLLGRDSLVLTLQNGLGNIEALEQVLGPERLLAGVTGQGATWLGPGRVRHAGFGKTYLGWARLRPGADQGLPGEVASKVFGAAGLEAEAVERVERYIWHKLILNAAINPLGALLRVRNGDLLSLEPCRELISELVREAVAVARLSGILLPANDYVAEVEALLAQTKDNLCSMLQDVLRGKRTEVAHINGALGRTAVSMGMDISVNAHLASLVEATEQSYPRRVRRP